MLDEIVGRAARYLPAAGGQTEEPEQSAPSPVIDRKAIERATQTLQDYKKGKASLESRIVEEERWWRLRHWDVIRGKNSAQIIIGLIVFSLVFAAIGFYFPAFKIFA